MAKSSSSVAPPRARRRFVGRSPAPASAPPLMSREARRAILFAPIAFFSGNRFPAMSSAGHHIPRRVADFVPTQWSDLPLYRRSVLDVEDLFDLGIDIRRSGVNAKSKG